MTKPYRQFEHTADIGIIVQGKTVEGLFENAAWAFSDLLIGADRIGAGLEKRFEITAGDLAELMVNWLGELLYLFEAERVVFSKFHVEELSPQRMTAKAFGESYDPKRHPVQTCFKAVTYHMLEVEQRGQIWQARVIFDV